MIFKLSDRLSKLPPYLFVEIDRAKRKARLDGRDIIDLGIGDPDEATPREVIDALYKASLDPKNHHYPLDQGNSLFREKIRDWYKERFQVALDPDSEILPLIGSKEGISHIPLAFVNPGDISLIPDPCYPPYKGGTILAGGEPYLMPLLEKNGFLPDLKAIKPAVLKKAKLIYINYPNNPTTGACDRGFFEETALFAKKNKLIVVSDLAYSEIVFDGYQSESFLSAKDAKSLCIEFHSLSKTCNMTGWRIGFACGNKELIAGLAKVKSNIDSGVFTAMQIAGITALEIAGRHSERMNNIYEERRDALVDGLNKLGWAAIKPKATFYVWARLPKGYKSSLEFAGLLLEKADIVITPGIGFGDNGEGYVRFALTTSKDRIQEAVGRIGKIL